jgi:xanthine dehydrogenase YagT iron-sulfur-binding subunit
MTDARDQVGWEVSHRTWLYTATALGAGHIALDAGAQALEPAAPATLAPQATSQRMAMLLTVNGQRHAFAADPRTTLLDALREQLLLTGTRKDCDHGKCGACTVLVDECRINSCVTLAAMHDGHAITTIEGIARRAHLHPLQQVILKHDVWTATASWRRA